MPRKSVPHKWQRNKDFPRKAKTEAICHQQTKLMRDALGSPTFRRKGKITIIMKAGESIKPPRKRTVDI